MTPGPIELKNGRPTAIVVTYRGSDNEYLRKDFLAEIHDVSPITESKEAILSASAPAPMGLERTIILVNSVRAKKEDPEMTSVDFDTQPPILDGKVPKKIRPELEETIRKEAQNYGYTLANTHFLYPQGE